MKFSHYIKYLVLPFSLVLFSNCEDDDMTNNQLQSNDPVFNIDLFEQNIINYVNGGGNTPVGWAYTISLDGGLEKSDDFGLARTAADGSMNFSLNKEINVASITKFYTAIAAFQLLKANNLTIKDSIFDWLPPNWGKGPGVNSLTFQDLLKHESGLESTNTNFDDTLGYIGLKDCIATGVINSKSRNYLNVNFALFRVLIPSLWSALNGSPVIDIESSPSTRAIYLQYMQENVFSPSSISGAGCEPENRSNATLYYNVNDPGNATNGEYYTSWSNNAGGGGYFLTPIEMSKVLAFYEHTEILLTTEQKDEMKLHRIGFDTADVADEKYGKYYGKAGSIGTSGDPTVSQGVLAQMVMFPVNGVDCVVIMNNQGNNFQTSTSLRQSLYDAYNDAWE